MSKTTEEILDECDRSLKLLFLGYTDKVIVEDIGCGGRLIKIIRNIDRDDIPEEYKRKK